MNTWNSIDETGKRVLQLSPLGVLPAHQRRGHGSELVRASLDAVRAAGEPLLLVEGAPAYYGRFGFVRADELGLLPPPEALYDWAFQVAVLDREAVAAAGSRRLLGAVQALSKREREPPGGAITAICSHGTRHFDPLTAVPSARIRPKTPEYT
jgi:GNAT superfamily N-acetyltransferase